MTIRRFVLVFLLLVLTMCVDSYRKRPEDKTKCPKVKAIRNFNVEDVSILLYIVLMSKLMN